MSEETPEDQELAVLLGQTAARQAEEADRGSPHWPEPLRPLDDSERARLTEALFPPAVTPLPRRRPSRLIVGMALAAGIAAGALLLRSPSAELPRFEMSAASGRQVVRSSTGAASNVYSPGSRLELVFQPERPVPEAPPIEIRLVHGGSAPRALDLPVERSPDGAIRLLAFVGAELPLPPGESTLVVLIGPARNAQRFEYPLVLRPSSP